MSRSTPFSLTFAIPLALFTMIRSFFGMGNSSIILTMADPFPGTPRFLKLTFLCLPFCHFLGFTSGVLLLLLGLKLSYKERAFQTWALITFYEVFCTMIAFLFSVLFMISEAVGGTPVYPNVSSLLTYEYLILALEVSFRFFDCIWFYVICP